MQSSRSERGIVLCVAMAAFVFQFEAFMVNVSLPTIAGELNASTSHVSFVVIAYLVAATAAFLPAGKLGDRNGLKRTFVAACVTAMAGTLLCGFATDLQTLMVSRFVQGLGAGGMAALGYAMIPAWLPSERTGWGFGYLNMAAGIGMLAGVPFGGLVSQYASWRWIFFCNVPLIAVLTASALRCLPGDSSYSRTVEPLDATGTISFAAIMSTGVFCLSLGSELGWTSKPILAAFALSVGLAAAMAIRRRWTGRSFFTRGLFRNSGFFASLIVLFLVRTALGGTIFLVPFYLAFSCSLSPLLTSGILLAYPAAYAPVGPCAGRLADRIGARPLVISAGLLGACASALFAFLLPSRNAWIAVSFLFILGLAMGMFFAPNNRFSMECAPEGRKGEAAALIPLALNMGTILGICVLETIFSMDFPGGTAHLRHMDGTDAGADLQSEIRGFSDAFLVGTGVFLAAAMITLAAYRTPAGGGYNEPERLHRG